MADVAQVPRGEYPRPQFVRPDWLCLNGPWEFEIDWGDSGLERGLTSRPLKDRIIVPFCPESPLSGVGCRDFMPAVWYRREVAVPAGWSGRRVRLHLQACDYDATVWVNGVQVARHRGGFTPLVADVTAVAAPGSTATVVVRARDDHRQLKPRGKQSPRHGNYGCHYTRTTGIWQTVWMEPVPEPCRLERPRITPEVGAGRFVLDQPLSGQRGGLAVRAALTDDRGVVAQAAAAAAADFTPRLVLEVPGDRRRLWQPADPHLYGLRIELADAAGRVIDRADSYAGLRSVSLDGPAVCLNGRRLFQRLVLDQGYYADGVLTAPSDEALRRDIELALAAGFNGARLHQKVFEERFLYHADRLGYLVWGEFADWGCRDDQRSRQAQRPDGTYITQWLEVLHRDYSHPSIVGWCPLNETYEELEDHLTALDDVTRGMFLAAKAMDTSRPVLDASGYSHRLGESDVWDCHDYEQDPAAFAARHAGLAEGRALANGPADRPWSIPWGGQPFMVSEFGGTWWSDDGGAETAGWGYGTRPASREELHRRFEALCGALLGNGRVFGYCYTQLTDVYQEQNGVYTFDRRAKFDIERIRRAQGRPAAIEAG